MQLKRFELFGFAALLLAVLIYGIVLALSALGIHNPFAGTNPNLGLGTTATSTQIVFETLAQSEHPNTFALSQASEFQDELKELPAGSLERARTQRHLAESAMPLDIRRAMQLLRDISADTSYPASERALAVEIIVNTFFDRSNNSPIWAEENVFVGTPFSQFAATSTSSTWTGMKKVSEHALTISPLPGSEYYVALWNARKGDAEAAKKHLARGDELLDAFTAQLDEFDTYLIPKLHRIRAQVHEEIGRVAKDPEHIAAARDAYEKSRALAIASRPGSSGAIALELVWTDFRFLEFLAREGSAADDALITTLVGELQRYNEARFQFNKYVARVGTDKKVAQDIPDEKATLTKVANRSAEFKTLLRRLGWNL